MAHAFVVCVKINNEELFFNAFLFENYIILVLDGLRCGAYTGNLSSTLNSSRLCVIFRYIIDCVYIFYRSHCPQKREGDDNFTEHSIIILL